METKYWDCDFSLLTEILKNHKHSLSRETFYGRYLRSQDMNSDEFDNMGALSPCNYEKKMRIMYNVEEEQSLQLVSKMKIVVRHIEGTLKELAIEAHGFKSEDPVEIIFKLGEIVLAVFAAKVKHAAGNRIRVAIKFPLYAYTRGLERVTKIQICKSRFTFKTIHMVLDSLRMIDLQRHLFPSDQLNGYNEMNSLVGWPLRWFQDSVKNNREQHQAVEQIVSRRPGLAPYILFGPPGTGKTTTLVEAIAQIFTRTRPSILVTATTNDVCDEIAIRLGKVVGESNIIRLLSITIPIQPCSTMIRTHDLTGYDGEIVVSTAVAVHKQDERFDYLFIDECGSAWEGIALVSLASVSSNARIIFAGDPHQLGPVVQSKKAADMGLSISMLERLMKLPLYSKDKCTGQYNKQFLTKLTKNFRSHREILMFSSKEFYESELEPLALDGDVNWAQNWAKLPSSKRPIIFHSVQGKMKCIGTTKSCFNDLEIKYVMHYVKCLLTEKVGDKCVQTSDIGIISPYTAQCAMLKEKFNENKWNSIEIGTVECFQGREKSVIIFTTVRSGTADVGFLSNPKRLNVSLTRPKALLIVVGNAKTLAKDATWNNFIIHCRDRGLILEHDKGEGQLINAFKTITL